MARSKKIEGTRTRDAITVENPNLIQIIKGFNHRVSFNDMKSLEDDILERGILDPIKVRRDKANSEQPYILIDGERRYRAVVSLHKQGRTDIFIPINIKACDEQGAFEIAAVSNMQRSDITAIEEATIVNKLESWGDSDSTIATKLGKTTQWVSQRRVLSGASVDLKKAVESRKVPVDVALEIARNVTMEKQSKHVDKIISKASSGGAKDVRKESKKALGKAVRPSTKEVKIVQTTLLDLIKDNAKTDWAESLSPLKALEMMYSAITYAQGLTPQQDLLDSISTSIDGLSAPAEMMIKRAS